MGDKVRFLDKSKRSNKRCSSCQFWKKGTITTFGKTEITHHYCDNHNSDEYKQRKQYWSDCEYFTWAENIIDKNDLECPHCVIHPDDSDALCFYYSRANRKDNLAWAHFPRCIDKNCPIKHSELLNGEIIITTKGEVDYENQ